MYLYRKEIYKFIPLFVSGSSADKKMFGWKVDRKDPIELIGRLMLRRCGIIYSCSTSGVMSHTQSASKIYNRNLLVETWDFGIF